jgi:hypothetical protein
MRNHARRRKVESTMNGLTHALAAGIVLGLTPASPLAAPAANPPPLTFATHFVADSPAGAGGYDGILKVQIGSDGIVSGIYRPNGVGPFVQVSGGLDGDRIWLDFGSGGRERITGRYRDGAIVGGTYRHGRLWDFSAKPLPPHD